MTITGRAAFTAGDRVRSVVDRDMPPICKGQEFTVLKWSDSRTHVLVQRTPEDGSGKTFVHHTDIEIIEGKAADD